MLDASTLEALFRKVGLVRESEAPTPTTPPLAGTLWAVLDLPSKLPVHLWWHEDPTANEKSLLDRVKAVLPPGTLLITHTRPGLLRLPVLRLVDRAHRHLCPAGPR